MGISDKIKVAMITTDETTTFIIEIKEMIALSLIIYTCNDSKEIYQKVCCTFRVFVN